ncbi:Kunitz-type trypsin inhibitor KTI1 [Senna tora]|uniref:Kunitz-type trypsin inhibitor KTI1 n=1 Tax=Senna tora TaxID=362788 RepID=A0A834T034_9FABA|nr:Kunitz-type trypsin inhibitor KTI1 [Senna tora]
MKIATTSLSLLFLVFAYAIAVDAAANAEIVYDAEGNPMEINGTYNMLLATPQFGGAGGIIETVAVSHDDDDAPCSLAVVEGESNSTGLPVTITSCRPSSKPTNHVTTSSCLVFSFAYVPPNNCTNSSLWVFRRSDSRRNEFVEVLTSGSDAIGGSSFYIKPSESARAKYTYWLNCDNQIFAYCQGVGVKKYKGHNRLFLLHAYRDPLVLQFHKVHDYQKNDPSNHHGYFRIKVSLVLVNFIELHHKRLTGGDNETFVLVSTVHVDSNVSTVITITIDKLVGWSCKRCDVHRQDRIRAIRLFLDHRDGARAVIVMYDGVEDLAGSDTWCWGHHVRATIQHRIAVRVEHRLGSYRGGEGNEEKDQEGLHCVWLQYGRF